MTHPEQNPRYPEGFDASRFTNPEKYLRVLEWPGVVSIGSEVATDEELESVADEMDDMGVVAVMPLYLYRSEGTFGEEDSEIVVEAIFPVYFTRVVSTVGEREFKAPFPINEEHVSEAERIIRGHFPDTEPEALEELITGGAYNLAFGEARRKLKDEAS